MTIKTVLHAYSFDIRTPEGKAAWQALESKLKAGPHCHGPVLADCYNFVRDLDGQNVDLETKHLFDNQWNTAPIAGHSEKGLRVFDWALESDSAAHAGFAAPGIRRGHYLEQTDEMRELRRNTHKCGYCGRQEPAAKGNVFCPHCLDSEYLKESDLKLTRMRPIDESGTGGKFPELTEAESAHLLPLYRAAQLHGTTERGKARIAKARRDIVEKRDKVIANATAEHDGFLWLMDHGINVQNCIFYSHTGRFSFGWRQPVDAAFRDGLLQVISEFPFPYEIKCDDGRTLSGNIG